MVAVYPLSGNAEVWVPHRFEPANPARYIGSPAATRASARVREDRLAAVRRSVPSEPGDVCSCRAAPPRSRREARRRRHGRWWPARPNTVIRLVLATVGATAGDGDSDTGDAGW